MVMANHARKAIFVLIFLLTALPRVCQSGSVPTVKKVIGPAQDEPGWRGKIARGMDQLVTALVNVEAHP